MDVALWMLFESQYLLLINYYVRICYILFEPLRKDDY